MTKRIRVILGSLPDALKHTTTLFDVKQSGKHRNSGTLVDYTKTVPPEGLMSPTLKKG